MTETTTPDTAAPHYHEGYHNGWPVVMRGTEPVGDFVGELNKLADEIDRLRDELAGMTAAATSLQQDLYHVQAAE